MKTTAKHTPTDADPSTMSTAALLREKARLEQVRIKARDEHKAAAAPLVAEQFRRARHDQLVARLRNNQEPKPHELEFLAGLTTEQTAALEAQVAKSTDAAKAKNPDWKPLRNRRKYDLAALVAKAAAK
jgi:hypothetical protein